MKEHSLLYRIIPELGLIIDVWSGNLSSEIITENKEKQSEDYYWDKSFSTLSDLRRCEFSNIATEVENIIKYLSINQKWSQNRKTAHLTSSPDQVVFGALLNDAKPQSMEIGIKTVSTLEGALNWLDIRLEHIEKIESILDELIIDGIQNQITSTISHLDYKNQLI